MNLAMVSMAGLRTGQKLIVKTRKIKMENVTEITLPKERENLAENWKWNPWLVADVTLIVSRAIGSSQTIKDEDFHSLVWFSSTGGIDVIVEIRDGKQSLLVNSDLWRPHREYLALQGIAAKYELELSEFSFEDQ